MYSHATPSNCIFVIFLSLLLLLDSRFDHLVIHFGSQVSEAQLSVQRKDVLKLQRCIFERVLVDHLNVKSGERAYNMRLDIDGLQGKQAETLGSLDNHGVAFEATNSWQLIQRVVSLKAVRWSERRTYRT